MLSPSDPSKNRTCDLRFRKGEAKPASSETDDAKRRQKAPNDAPAHKQFTTGAGAKLRGGSGVDRIHSALVDLSDLTDREIANLRRRLEEKFTPEPMSGCWLWHGATTSRGYGSIAVGYHAPHRPIVRAAHRVMWILANGPVPDGLFLDHKHCQNPSCVNPRHLEPVTLWENTLRGRNHVGQNARATHCRKGHEFTEANTRIESGKFRRCRTCDAENRRRYRSEAA